MRRYRVGPVVGESEIERHDRLVQKLFYQAGIFDSADTPLAEKADEAMIQRFLARHKNEPIGGLSIVRSPGEFPVEQFFNVELPTDLERSQIAELTRFVIEPEHRRKNGLVAIKLLQSALTYSRKNQIRWWIWCAPSVFLWGLQSYFGKAIVLKQLPLTAEQEKMRIGRESYFDASRAIRVVLIDLDTISITNSGIEFVKRWRRRSRSQTRK